MLNNPKNLNENAFHEDAGEADILDSEMDHEASTTPTTAAQASLQNMALGEKEKQEKELATCS